MTETDVAVQVWRWEFFAPERLWVLLVIPAMFIIYLLLLRLKRNRGMRYTQTGVVGAILPRQPRWRRHVSVIMTLASLVAVTGAWARPVGTERVPRERATIVLVLDQSLSMQATDVDPSRMEASKEAAKSFVTQLPESYNVSIVGMSGSPAVLSPPTTDRSSTMRVIDAMDFAEGTAIGDSIQAAVSAVAMAPGDSEEPAPATILMLSDGQNTGGAMEPMEAAQIAAEQNIPIHTIAYGTQNGYVDLEGQRHNVAPDAELLSAIAQATGGRAEDASTASQLDDVYTQLESEVGYEDKKTEVTAKWALYAFGFAVVAALGAISMAARWP